MSALEQVAGLLVMAVALADTFLTVLYARMQSGFLGMRCVHGVAWVIIRASKALGRRGAKLATMCGPVSLVALIALWVALLTLGAALVLQPALGREVTSSTTQERTDFLTALYVAGASISVVGSSGYEPNTPLYRIVFLFDSAIGMSFVSLIVTYMMQVYNALLRRNALGIKIHALSEEKGDGAELVCRLGPRGEFASSTSVVADLAAEMCAVKESHHFYPLLLYFRFEEAHYAVSRFTLVCLDALSLVMSSLDDELAWVTESAGATQLWRSSLLMLHALVRTADEPDCVRKPRTPEQLAVWRRRYEAAVARMDAAHIPLRPDFDRYAQLRSRWDDLVAELAPELAYPIEHIDPPTTLARA